MQRSSPRHNLPEAATRFVGRDAARLQVTRLLRASRLLTLTGPGGAGKTRLALELAEELLGLYRDGVWLVDLAPVGVPSLVLTAVAAVFHIEVGHSQSPAEALTLALADKQALLILDNCEHVISACAELVTLLLRGGTALRFLATSREPLRVAGETIWAVPPLELPAYAPQASARLLEKNEAVQLFLDRARARKPDLKPSSEDLAAAAEACRRLDGIPLAIELAAALVTTYSIPQLASLLGDGLPVLVYGQRVESRKETMRASFDRSYALLSESERALFRRLAVFHGGWDLDMLAPVCVLAGPDSDTLDHRLIVATLAGLVEKSMVVVGVHGLNRYRLLEPVRQYAWERLLAADEVEAVRLQHARAFTALAETLQPSLTSARRQAALDRLAADIENLRAALTWALPAGDTRPSQTQADLGLRLASALAFFWHFRGPRTEGAHWLEAALRWVDERADRVAAEALHMAGEFAWLLGERQQGRTRMEQSLCLWRALDESRGLAYTLQGIAPCLDDSASRAAIAESLALFEQLQDGWGLALARFTAGLTELEAGAISAARLQMEDALASFQALADDWFAAQVLTDLGDVERASGRAVAAGARYRQALNLARTCGDTILLPSLLYNLGLLAGERGQTRRSLATLQSALVLFRDRGDRRGVAECLIGVAGVLTATGQLHRAVRLFGAAEALLTQAHLQLWSTSVASYTRAREAARAQLSPRAFARVLAAGQSLSVADAIAEALPEMTAPRRAQDRAVPAVPESVEQLTAREREVAALVARGYSNRQIAAALVITPGTAGLHVKRILHKLGYSSRVQVAAQATALGIACQAGHDPDG